ILFLQAARRVKRNIVIDELAEVRVKRRYAALLVVLSIFRAVEAVGHFGAQLAKVLVVRVIINAKSRGAQRTEQSSEAAFKDLRSIRGHQAAQWLTVFSTHWVVSRVGTRSR